MEVAEPAKTVELKIPEDYTKLLREFIEKRGSGLQKVFIKKLWSVREDLLDNLSDSEMRMMFFTVNLATCPEGVKLLASFIQKIGPLTAFRLVQKLIIQFNASSTDCHKYGDVFKTAWKIANNENNYDLTEVLETEVISQLCYYSMYANEPIAQRYRDMLVPFVQEKKVNKNMDFMITTQLNSCMYRGLKSSNDVVRISSTHVFFMFYPLVDSDPEEMKRSLVEQHKIMVDLLSDTCTIIRSDAIRKVLKILAEYWLIIPKDVVKQLMSMIVDTLSRDSVISVRVSVFEGMKQLVIVPSCMNAFEHALKCITLRGINDKSDRVRLAAFSLLNQLKSHRFINIFDIVSRDEVIARLDIEPVEAVCKKIVPIIHTLIPISKDVDEAYYRPRINYIIGKSRMAILTYFRLLYPMKIVDAEMATKLIEMLLIWAYRYLRKKTGPPLAEDSDGFHKARIYLECALILYISCRSLFLLDENFPIKAKIDKHFVKIVSEIFDKYRSTPLMGTATAISSAIPKESLKSGLISDCFSMLESDEIPDDAIEAFVETASHLNIDSLFLKIFEGLNGLKDVIENSPTLAPKKVKRAKLEDSLGKVKKSLTFLKFIIKSHTTMTLIATRERYREELKGFAEKIDNCRDVIDYRLKSDQELSVGDDLLILAFQLRFILPIYVASSLLDDEESLKEQNRLIGMIRSLLSWFHTNVSSKMKTFGEQQYEFLVKLTKAVFDCVGICLTAWNFREKIQLEEENNENEEEQEDEGDVPEMIAKTVLSFCNSSSPIDLFSPMNKTASILCDDDYSECHGAMVKVLHFAPKWLKKYCEELEENEKIEDEKEICDSLKLLYRKVSETDDWNQQENGKFIELVTLFAVIILVDEADEVEFADPRHSEYVAPNWVNLVICKCVAKEKALLRSFLENIPKFLDMPKFIGDEIESNICLVRLCALIQLLRIINNSSSKDFESHILSAILKCHEKIEQIMKRTEDTPQNIDNYITNSILVLLDLEKI